jgi:hypothetical protein
MTTFRMWVPSRMGRADLHFTGPIIKANSVIHISASEASDLFPGQQFGGFSQNFSTIFGAASITVQNVSVREGVVDFYVFVDWPHPLNIVTDITILDPPEQIIIGN